MIEMNSEEQKRQKKLEYCRRYYQEHKEYFKKYKEKYYQEHKEWFKKYSKKYQKDHRDEYNARSKKWRMKNVEKCREYARKRWKAMRKTDEAACVENPVARCRCCDRPLAENVKYCKNCVRNGYNYLHALYGKKMRHSTSCIGKEMPAMCGRSEIVHPLAISPEMI